MNEFTGIVIKIYGAYYTILYDNNEINCTLKGRLRTYDIKYSNPVAVGDKVLFELNQDSTGTVVKILPRKSVFSRRERGKNRKIDILAANIDTIIVCQSFNKPKMNLRFVDRLLVSAKKEEINFILCVNKLDLASDSQIEYIDDYFLEFPFPIILTSALNEIGLSELEDSLQNKTSILMGNSGVGKSTIINKLFPDLNLRVSEVSEKTGKGKHTTSNSQMIVCNENMNVIDTPGLREFGIIDVEPHLLSRYFHEFSEYHEQCKFQPCTHDHEPECMIKDLVNNGEIHQDRYVSYLNILHSLQEYYDGLYD